MTPRRAPPDRPGTSRTGWGPAWSVAPLLIGTAAFALYGTRLGVEILRTPLEVKYALVARQMLAGGPLLVPHLFGELYPDKPPLYFWVTTGLGWLAGGIDERVARLPAAVAASAGVALVARLGTDLFGPGGGLAAACSLATSNLFFWYARQGHPDQFLTTFVTLAYLGLWHGMPRRPGRTRWTLLAYLAMGLAVLSKGALGALLPLLGASVYVLMTRRLRAVPSGLQLRVGLPVLLGVVLAWYGPAVARAGSGYVYETLVHHHLTRYLRAWIHRESWYYYLGQFPVQFFPWTLFLPGAIALGWRASRRAEDERPRSGGPDAYRAQAAGGGRRPVLLPLAWLASGFVFLSLSSSKRGAYLLPLYPAAALLVGWLWSRAISGARSRWVTVPLAGLSVAALVLALVLALVPRALLAAHIGTASRADTLLPATAVQRIAVVTLLAGGGLALAWTWHRARLAAAFGLLVGVQALVLIAAAVIRAPEYEARWPVRALASRVDAAVPRDHPVLIALTHDSLLAAFYVPRPVALLASDALAPPPRDAEARYALVDAGAAVTGDPRAHRLDAAPLGGQAAVLVRLDPDPG